MPMHSPPASPLAPGSKNIVVCLDGTGNKFEASNTNVVKLFQLSLRDAGQIAYYDPGVGTLGDAGYKTSLARKLNAALGGAIGVGLMKNVEQAYAYLMDHHLEGDRIYIFGFSRGAFTARVLAGLINRCGLFEKGCQNLIPYAMESFLEQQKQAASGSETQDYFRLRSSFRRTFGRRLQGQGSDDGPRLQTPIHFLGLWDTVKSYGRLYNPSRIPRESTNESVRTVRHAIALDERRVFFPQMHWQRKGKQQDVHEVWFAGVHGDVGGTPAEIKSGLSKITLDWMLRHAVNAGLRIDHDDRLRIVHGIASRSTDFAPAIAKPDPAALRHESLSGPWWLIEALPWRRNDGPGDGPLCWWRGRREPERLRAVPGSAVLHGSMIERISQAQERYQGNTAAATYRPGQLPLISVAGHERLAAGLPVLAAGPDPLTLRLLLPLPDGSGEVLMHRLSQAECQAWPAAGCDDGGQALALLAVTAGGAIKRSLPGAVLRQAAGQALATARQTLGAAPGNPAANWLDALTLDAFSLGAAVAAKQVKPTDTAITGPDLALRAACAPLGERLAQARAVLRCLARWGNEIERAGVAASGGADPGAAVLCHRLYLARTAPRQSRPEALAMDAMLEAFECTVQAGIALLAADGGPGGGHAAPAAARSGGDTGGAASDCVAESALADALERALEAWVALRAPAAVALAPQQRLAMAALLARLAVAAPAPPGAAKRATQLQALLTDVQALRAGGDGRYLALAQALHPDEAVDQLAGSFKGVVDLVDWPAAFDNAAAPFKPAPQPAAASAAQPLDALIKALGELDTALGKIWLEPGQRQALNSACGHVHGSLVTWADRLP